MALSANTVIEVRFTGADTNGGGFVTGASGTDWSQQDAAQYFVTDGVTAGTTTITSATANFGTDVVGNLIYVQGGTGSITAGWYEITARASATSITVDRSTGLTAGTGVTLKIGGALASPGMASAIAIVANMKVFIKYNASAYIITSATVSISGGCVSLKEGVRWAGYDTTRDLMVWPVQNRPTIRLNAGVTAANMFNGSAVTVSMIEHFIIDGNSNTTSTCTTAYFCYYVKAMNGTTAGFNQGNGDGTAILCEATNCTTKPFFGFMILLFCVSHDNTLTTPANVGAFNAFVITYGCIAYGNNTNGFAQGLAVIGCVAYNNALYGFDVRNSGFLSYINCIAENNAQYGFGTSGSGTFQMTSCATYNNTSGRSNVGAGKLWIDAVQITGSGSFFTNAAGADFTLNNTAGGGASARAAGFPTSFPVPAMNNYRDVGAVQHQDAGPIAQLKQFNRGTPY